MEQLPSPGRPVNVLYGAAVHNVIAGGQLAEMKQVASQAEEYVASHGDISAALEVLKIEIAKLKAKS